MQQVDKFISGQLDYNKLTGSTGRIAYPAGFLYVFSLFYYLTDGGEQLLIGQLIFLGLLLATNIVVFKILERAHSPFHTHVLCILSKRLHSIFLLRLFNDPVAALFAYLAVYNLIEKRLIRAFLSLCAAVSVKMNVLLLVPGFLVVVYRNEGYKKALGFTLGLGIVQFLLSLPFKNYFTVAFDFNRRFMYQWTVNYRFLPHPVFFNEYFHLGLLIGHLAVLLLFLHFKWLPSGIFGSLRTIGRPPEQPCSASEAFKIIATCNLIGISFARSLHYQFYSWYFHTLPFLVYFALRVRLSKIVSAALSTAFVAAFEYCWNVYPSTFFSSALLHVLHLILLVLLFVE